MNLFQLVFFFPILLLVWKIDFLEAQTQEPRGASNSRGDLHGADNEVEPHGKWKTTY